VGAIRLKAMPVILRTPEEVDIWMTAPVAETLKLQRQQVRGGTPIRPRQSAFAQSAAS
jgi:hypothetical protein